MINLLNDYNKIAHKNILDALIKYQDQPFVGYGKDDISANAVKLIKKELNNDSVDIHFIVGGTLTNKVALSSMLKNYEAVICCDSAHINVHETGAIEETGHKLLVTPNKNGKVDPIEVKKIYLKHVDEHMVKPRVVYISNSTEFGTIYNKEELIALSNVCKELGLYLYLDGARLSTALTSKYNDLTMEDICKYTDMFYIGGAKIGLMFGEALVVVNDSLKQDFRYLIKNQGAMLSKGFLCGIQFETLFTNNLFYEIGKKENELAYILTNELTKLGIKLYCETETNQIFPLISKQLYEYIKTKILFEVWEDLVDEIVIRFVTGFDTTMEDINKALLVIKEFQNA